jgi:hypothetical protein
MAFLHTPGCRITFMRVRQGARENILRVGESVEFTFGVSIDPFIWFQPGNFRIDHTILDGQNQTLINQPTWRGWTATDLPAKPAANFWVQQFSGGLVTPPETVKASFSSPRVSDFLLAPLFQG